jgi:SAM-dependent methyltransferase
MELRARACAGLTGRVLEIGFGSGLNVGLYPPEVSSVDAVEPLDEGWARSRARRSSTALPIDRTGLDGQHLAAPDEAYDSVLSTFTFCTIPDPALAMSEIRRVLAPGGALHFLEHTRAPDSRVERWQRRLDPIHRSVFGGCRLTRDPEALAKEAGFDVEGVDNAYVWGLGPIRPWTHASVGRVVKPGPRRAAGTR